jgi:glycosyltransferase involved in cell wall biosynthesis
MACVKPSRRAESENAAASRRSTSSDGAPLQRRRYGPVFLPVTGADISVVIPARNEEARLPGCLSRLRDQSLQGFEVIVVDSASSDETGAVARDLGARVIRVDRPGVGLARQTGFDAARRSLIVSTDADALPSSDWLEHLVEPFQNPATVCAFGTIRLAKKGLLVSIGHGLFRAFQRVNALLRRPICCGPNFAVRAEAFRNVGGFAVGGVLPNDAEDVRLALKLRSVGNVVYLPHLAVDVSARSLVGRKGITYIAHNTRVYFRVCWFRKQLATSR